MQAANLFNTIDDWWDPKGALRSLHWINPARLKYVQQQIGWHFGFDTYKAQPYAHLKILDIGCGGGLVCEPMARLGATVTGIDLSETAIATAQQHAQTQSLKIDYRCIAAENLAALPQNYDVVLALDMLEHVTDPAAIIQTISKLTKPGGLTVLSTINRNWQAWLGAIKLAENVFKIAPKGAHAYQLLIRPDELVDYCEAAGLTVQNLCGIVPKPSMGGMDFILSPQRLGVNYLLAATKSA